MALTNTTLAVAAAATDESVTLTSATGVTVGCFIRMDDEYAFVSAINGVVAKLTQRGQFGSKAVAHKILAPVCVGLVSDLPRDWSNAEPKDNDYLSIGADGAIAVPTRDTTYFINKGSALATSALANPSAAQNGLTLTFVGTTDFAHVITATTSADGTTGNHTTWTSAAFKGSTLTVVAFQGTWLVRANNLWVIT